MPGTIDCVLHAKGQYQLILLVFSPAKLQNLQKKTMVPDAVFPTKTNLLNPLIDLGNRVLDGRLGTS